MTIYDYKSILIFDRSSLFFDNSCFVDYKRICVFYFERVSYFLKSSHSSSAFLRDFLKVFYFSRDSFNYVVKLSLVFFDFYKLVFVNSKWVSVSINLIDRFFDFASNSLIFFLRYSVYLLYSLVSYSNPFYFELTNF